MTRRLRHRQPPPDPATQLLHTELEALHSDCCILRERIATLEQRLYKAYEIARNFSLADVRRYLKSAIKGTAHDPEAATNTERVQQLHQEQDN